MIANPCIFCLDEQRFPCRISCGHSFCTECFGKYLELVRDSRCPICRRDFRTDFHPTPADSGRVTFASTEDPESMVSPTEAEMDTLVLTLSEQECRFFEQLYRELQLVDTRE
ncbi:postreplication repair E3 ubiquitin-protein ligase RAD18 [Drosophila elegans]|uniref:postreplication repair E3 ubiquitin-protein ligase RAD18 n=1 Tax=Drosophila elegans TaxID=30023 RepID=UPI0007E66264|nr:postreplication repair E3 ubiquitin-protein ligase RAD18 [Drosophila elegans]